MTYDPARMRPINILLIEDSPTDVLITREALESAKVINNLQVAEDGVEALAILRRQGRHAGAPRPDLILLDLNLPHKDGRQVLLRPVRPEDEKMEKEAYERTESQSQCGCRQDSAHKKQIGHSEGRRDRS